jgi:GT2 family glycosyltransferase/SAM-dependent methyltransferase
MSESRPVSVIVATLGRVELLRACLASLAACEPVPDEVLVVVQGSHQAAARQIDALGAPGFRAVPCTKVGKGFALNLGLEEARNDLVAITDDDCRVAPSWIGVGWEGLTGTTDTILTGRVLAEGDPDLVPATIDDTERREYAGRNAWGMLYGGNMACRRTDVLAIGGFDERMRPAAEDDELSYRWVRAGKRITYDPDLIVWHAAWRSPEQLRAVYVGYARGQGAFYGKHLRQGDLRLLPSIAGELYAGIRGSVDGMLSRRSAASDPRQGILRGLVPGLVAGWRGAGSKKTVDPSDPSRSDSALRRAVRRVRPLRSAWLLLRALAAAIADGPRTNRLRVEREFATPDPWDYAGSSREQECLQHQAEVLDRIERNQRFASACEIGCAEGVFTEALEGRCEALLAVDLSGAALDRARRRRNWPAHVSFEALDLRSDPLPGRYTLIVVAGVLEYLDRPRALRAARQKLVDALAPGGSLFVVTTRNQVAERAWWSRVLPRGARINEYVGRHPLLRTQIEEKADWYVISVFERQR